MTEGPFPTAEALDYESHATPDDAADIRLWLRLLTCTTMMERALRRRLLREFSITLPRFDALAQLERAPAGLTMGQLSRRMMVTGGNVTGVVDRLVADGLAERVAVPEDRRASLVRLTGKGRRAFARMTPVHHGWVHDMLSGLGGKDMERLMALLGRLKSSIRAAGAAEPTSAEPTRKET